MSTAASAAQPCRRARPRNRPASWPVQPGRRAIETLAAWQPWPGTFPADKQAIRSGSAGPAPRQAVLQPGLGRTVADRPAPAGIGPCLWGQSPREARQRQRPRSPRVGCPRGDQPCSTGHADARNPTPPWRACPDTRPAGGWGWTSADTLGLRVLGAQLGRSYVSSPRAEAEGGPLRRRSRRLHATARRPE